MDLFRRKMEEARKTYESYWESYLKGDLETFASTLDEQFEMIGTSESEICHCKAEGIKFLKAQMHEVVGKAEMRNRQIDLLPVENLMLVNEQCDIYVLVDLEWSFYSKIRISTWLRETDSGWKVIQQHGSLPDMRVQEGETLALEKISKENLELRDAVKRRTAELENKNRELAIEAALEKVRAVAMGMKNPNAMLDVCRVIAEQLEEFGVTKIRNVQTAVIDEHIGQYLCYQYFPAYGQTTIEDTKYHKSPVEHEMVRQMLASRDGHFTGSLSGKELKEFGLHRKEENHFPDPLLDAASEVSYCFLSIGEGGLGLSLYQAMDAWVLTLFRRFHQVFSLAYQRFRDIQKAEAQAREVEIELALERVRARTMAMQKSDELPEAANLLFQQVQSLGMPAWSAGYCTWVDDKRTSVTLWMSSEGVLQPPFTAPTTEDELFIEMRKGQEDGKAFHAVEMGGDKLVRHYHYMRTLPVVGDILDSIIEAGHPLPTFQIMHQAYFSKGFLLFITYEPVPESHDIFLRFAQVFEQTYTRFLDLKKAEAQAREAQIEAALEKVRSQAMAMHSSHELKAVARELRTQLGKLGQRNLETCAIHLYEESPTYFHSWAAVRPPQFEGEIIESEVLLPKDGGELVDEMLTAYFSKQKEYVILVNGEKAVEWFALLKSYYPEVVDLIIESRDIEEKNKEQENGFYFSFADFSGGSLVMVTYTTPDDESRSLLGRFANVFGIAYRRFSDLQKAEAQAKEAQVEAALERLRSKTMAMHNSKDVGESVATLFDELTALGVLSFYDRCGIGIMQPHEMMEVWTAEKSTGKTELTIGHLDMRPHALLRNVYQSWLDRKETFRYTLVGEDKQLYAEAIVNQSNYKIRKDYFSSVEKIEHTDFFFEEGCLYIFSVDVISNESAAVFSRFVKVFGQTYRRYLDLQKAEKQAREAQIEAALEKVRSRSLAMQSPDELIEVVQLLREEMGALGVEELETSSIYIHDDESGATQCWFTIKNSQNPGKTVTDQMTLDLQDTWVGRKMLDFYRSPSNQTSILMQGEQRIEWIRYCEGKSELFGTSNFFGEIIPERTYHLYKFSNGYIGAAAPGEISAESWDLLRRTTAVFSFAYTRFQDLQRAEASARTAMRQASLDRVRAEISSMRHVDDLDRITPLFFHELTTLGIPFIRCGVFIIQEKQEIVEAYLSSPDGNSLGILRLPYQASELTFQTVEAWRKGLIYRQHWNKEDFVQWINQLIERDQIQDSSTYQGTAAPPESLDLHFVPFAQGMLYVGAEEALDEKELELVQALAKAFSIAYARYEDFVKLEHAKLEIESAMIELKATQSQLVQQEKLASLGQLTAGIAHEIKNPLNFVNNFSEVSIEMIEEALEEMEKREARDETLIRENLEDIKSNLKKVHEHGSRANGIVTSMLQHSRGGSGKKDPTDLNALIKEYVNLSFHGMRAGKDPIDVELAFELDDKIANVPIIKEDFIRVIINLCNNAFDAMRGKLYQVKNTKYEVEERKDINYLPKLAVSTILDNGRVRISIEDNGPGIPEAIKDKILQPFFTTKKGTEGTGLGLSITHDIIKAHGGELKVETKEGEGSEFIILLKIKE